MPALGGHHSEESRAKISRAISKAQTGRCGPLSNRWSGGRHQGDRGYIVVWAGSAKHAWEHRAIAAQVLGRPLRTSEVVHHVNGDKADNSHPNLLICDRKYHQWLHSKMSDLYIQEHFAGTRP